MKTFTDIDVRIGPSGLFDIVTDADARDIETDDGLWSAILVSLFTDRRAAADEVLDPIKRRGWLGNTASDIPGDNMGSGLWLYEQSRLTQSVASSIEAEARNALQWLITDGLCNSVVASVERDDRNRDVVISIQIGLVDGGVSRRAFILANATRSGILSNS